MPTFDKSVFDGKLFSNPAVGMQQSHGDCVFDPYIFDPLIFDIYPKPSTPEPGGVYAPQAGGRKKRLNPAILNLIASLLGSKASADSESVMLSEMGALQLWRILKGSKRLPSGGLDDVDLVGLASGEFEVELEEN